MPRSKLLISLLLPLLAGGLSACGRTAGLGSGSDGYQGRDTGPSPDFVRDSQPNSETLPSDVGPRPDWGPWPDAPPPPDWGPWPDAPPLPDRGPGPDGPPPPPPDIGPQPDLPPGCTPSCAELCKMTSGPCGILTYQTCIKDCATWSPSQFNCVAAPYCASSMPGGPPFDCAAVKKCLSQPQNRPDLTVTQLAAKVSGNTVTYSIRTCNIGLAASPKFFVDLYYNRPAPPSVQQYGDQFMQYASLAPGACRTTVFYRKNTPSGTYVSWAQVDADASVAESDEKNNVSQPVKLSVGTTPPKGPDLVVDSLTATVTGSLFASVRYAARVCNKGQSPTLSGTQVHIYYDRKTAPAPGQHGDKFASVPALKPGSCRTAYVTRTAPPPGSYTSWAQVDPDNWIKEAVETNNIAGPKNVIVGSSQGADLAIKSLTAQVYNGSSVRYRIQVCNKGTGTAGTTTVDVYFNRPNPPALGVHGDQVTLVPQLSPGACSTRSIFRSGTPTGTYVSWAQVDVPGVVKETDETNNIGGPTKVSVGGASNLPDLKVSSLAAKVSGSTVYYSIRVCNYGQQAAGYSRLDLYYNSPFPPSPKQTGNDVIKVSPLGVGACQILNPQRSNVPQGTYLSWARTDRLNQIQESNENNNLAGPRKITVGSTSTSCSTVCMLAIQCGLFSPVAFPECNTWCSKLNPWEKACVDKAVARHDCKALKSCAPVPPPPPPPPPGFCSNICGWLQSPCKLLASSQQAACVSLCQGLSPDKVTCAQNAQSANQCMQALMCVF